jgi:Kef-type K+ transport system membrane component KefB
VEAAVNNEMKTIFQYLLLVGVPVLGVLALLQVGQGLEAPPAPAGTGLVTSSPSSAHGVHLPILLIQISVILAASRLVGIIFRRFHQPQVMGEMVAGILLGPSLLGWLAPGVSATLFPPESLGFLNALSQVGLLLFMFLVGLELDPELLRGRGHTAVVTSHVSILAPFLLGTLLALYLYPRLSDSSVPFINFALFIGIAMSITAFPVLARILTERNLLRTRVGSLTITCAAVDDVTGWCILAGVVLLVRAAERTIPLWATLAGVIVYILVMIFIVRPLMGRLERVYEKRGKLTQDVMAFIFLLVLLSGLVTEWLGIHALFGAFLVGAIMPKHHHFVQALTQKLEDAAVVLLLPLFFAFTGLRTSIGLVSGSQMWLYCGLIILVAIAGKFGGSTLAARVTGTPWREASTLGILMNTRGLMELVVLNIGLDIGILSPTLFTMMVLMALATTFMTAPLLQWVYFGSFMPEERANAKIEGLTPVK